MADMKRPGAGGAGAREVHATADCPEHNRPRRARQGAVAVIRDTRGERRLILAGRNLWALRALMLAGAEGITAISNPAPRLSGYIHRLRALGLDISTEHEGHGGPFAGHHACYRLHSDVTLEPEGGAP